MNSRLYTKSIAFEDINYQLAQNEDKTAIFENCINSSANITAVYADVSG